MSPSEQTILVTGANGFVGGHVVKVALEKGYHVRGTVRSESSAAKLKSVFADYADKLSFASVPDITKPELYEAAFASPSAPITGVIVVASPFALKVDDNKRDLLDPAIGGSIAALEAARRFGPAVKRVVNTSSFAGILDLGKGYRVGYTYTEADWNEMTYEQAAVAESGAAYCASKSLAEKAMWEWVAREKPGFTLSAVCPAWVFGPHVGGLSSTKHLNESTHTLYGLFGAAQVPPIDFGGFVDVRVLADALVAAFEKDEAAGQRFLLAEHFDYQSAVDAGREIPELRSKLPEGKPGSGPSQEVYQVDGTKAEKVLGIKYIPLSVSMKDSFGELLAAEKLEAAAAA